MNTRTASLALATALLGSFAPIQDAAAQDWTPYGVPNRDSVPADHSAELDGEASPPKGQWQAELSTSGEPPGVGP